jgi:hypothetical protein
VQEAAAPARLKNNTSPNIMKIILTALLTLVTALASARALDHSHAALDTMLARYVKSAGVNYTGLKSDRVALASYLDTLAVVTEPEFNRFTKEQQVAMLINLYNAATLQLVIDHYPVKSIKDIATSSGGPWKQPIVRLLGKSRSLDYLENDVLRPKFGDPRVHFAINCASVGCPALRADAFQASTLNQQLDEQTRGFLKDSTKNRIDAKNKILYLSPIFEWYKSDFASKSGTVEKFMANYISASDRAVLENGGLTIKYTDYSWALNQP